MLSPKEIQTEINQKIHHITDTDFAVIDEEQDGCDDYGHKYWLTCENGWYGRDHELDDAIQKALQEFYKTLIEQGFLASDDQRYQIPSDRGINYNPVITESRLFVKSGNTSELIQQIKQKIREFEHPEDQPAPYYTFMECHFPRTLNTSWEDFEKSLLEIYQWKFPYRYGRPEIPEIIKEILGKLTLTPEESAVITVALG